MTGPEHYREAERLLALAASSDQTTYEGENPEADRTIAEAQAHATLAQAAAIAQSAPVDGEADSGMPPADAEAWNAVAGVRPDGSGVVKAISDPSDDVAGLTIYQASHDSIALGLYTTRSAARQHCQTLMERTAVGALEWRPDGEWREDDDGEPGPDEAEELYEYGTHETSSWGPTGFVVTPVLVAAAYTEAEGGAS